MKINFFIDRNKKNTSLCNFILSLKKFYFEFQDVEKILNFKNENILYIFPPDAKISQFNRYSKILLNNNFKNIVFFLPKYFKMKIPNFENISLFYPISILQMENQILNKFNKDINFYNDVILFNDNILTHKKNNSSTHLTEIESKIIRLLFNNKSVPKVLINIEVLNQKPTVDSKSLESHLYRLRKKLFSIDKNIQIIANDEKSIMIRKIN